MKYTKNNRISGKWFPTDQVGKNNVQATSLLEIRIKINCSDRDNFKGERIRIFKLPRSFDVALFANSATFSEDSRNLHIIAALIIVRVHLL